MLTKSRISLHTLFFIISRTAERLPFKFGVLFKVDSTSSQGIRYLFNVVSKLVIKHTINTSPSAYLFLQPHKM